MYRMKLGILGVLIVMLRHAEAGITVTDDSGHVLHLERPAQRIVTLAPHLTETLFAIGAGDRIVGTVEYSDHPEAARAIPRIGDSYRIDIERILERKPDLVMAWTSGNPGRQLEALRRLGIPVFFSEPTMLDDIPRTMERLGAVTALPGPSLQASTRFRRHLQALRDRYAGRPVLRVFYQVSDRPLYTLNDRHWVSALLRVCGGTNIFGHLSSLAPAISPEAVVAENPDAILGSQPTDRLSFWQQYSAMTAVRHQAVYPLNADLLSRPGPRLLDGAEMLCSRLDQARVARQKGHDGPSKR